jgi:RNA polymerase sigma factor (sigma-70 family)
VGECSRLGLSGEELAHQMAAHEGLVRWVVRQQGRSGLTFEAALHAGRIGLWQALIHYDPARGARFSSYAVPAIRHAVWAAVAQHRAEARRSGRGGAIGAAPGEDLAERVDRGAAVIALGAAVSQLPRPWRRVVVWHYGFDGEPPRTFAAIGARLGVSRQRAQQLHAAAIAWLAQPDRSLPLRRLLGRHARGDYQATLARARRQQRARRGRR